MKQISLLLYCMAVALFSKSQDKTGIITLNGWVKDTVTLSPLEGATVSLKLKSNGRSVTTLTDSLGSFHFNINSNAVYILTVNYTGYTSFRKEYTNKNFSSPGVNKLVVFLAHSTGMLSDIIITAQKNTVENKIDKLVYNVDRDLTSQAGTATDVLRKVPQITVDINGNVELLGNPSVHFLINGKTSTLFGNSVSDALQSIPASQIQSIEVISSPGARYDASGTGGIINIILKKNKAQGFSGILNVSAGSRQENGSLNLNYKKNNVSVNAYFNGSDQLKVNTLSELTRNTYDTAAGNLYYLHQQGNSLFTRNSCRSGMGIDWDITPKNNFSASLSYNHFGNAGNGINNQLTKETNNSNILLDYLQSTRIASSTVKNDNIDFSADYHKKFRKEKTELIVSYLRSSGFNSTYYLQSQQYNSNDSVFAGSTSHNPGKDFLNSFSVDYSTPVTKTILAEAGVKIETEEIKSDADVLSFSPAAYSYIKDAKQSYTSVFKRKVYAGYASATFRLLSFLDVIAGLRWEHTTNNAWYSNSGNASVPAYNNLAPSLTIAHTFTKQQVLRFNYSYRLERPEFRDLNPFVNLTDPHNIVTGNPYIKPEIGRDFQLGYSQNLTKENYISIIFVYVYNSPDIKSYTTFYPVYQVGDSIYRNVNVTQRSNIADEHRFGLNLSGSFSVGSRLTIRPNIQLYDRRVNNIYAIPRKSGGFEYRGNLNAAYQFNKNLTAELFGNFRSGIKWQGRQAGFYAYSAAIRQQLFKGKGSIGIVAVNAMSKYLTQKSKQEAVGISATSVLKIPYRSFGISFMYKFGKLKLKAVDSENLLSKPPVENQ